MSPEEIEAALARGAKDATLSAVITLVEELCDAAAREATGFYTASVLNPIRDEAKAKFIVAMEKAAESAQPTEG